MESDETITDIFPSFTNIVNDLKSLGRTYSIGDLVTKFLDLSPSVVT